jgi:polysaccharide biosynthesis transport protein
MMSHPESERPRDHYAGRGGAAHEGGELAHEPAFLRSDYRVPGAASHELPSLPPEFGPPDAEAPGLWTLVSDRLSGRWGWAAALALLLAVAAGWSGYHATRPMYESTGMIHVAPKIVPIMRETPETAMTPNYPGFVQVQATLVSSDGVLDRAVSLIPADELPWSDPAEAIVAIRRFLSSEVDRSQQLIIVRYRSASPQLAQTVVNAVIRAYDEIHGAAEIREVSRKLNTLRDVRRNLELSLRQKRAQRDEAVATSAYAVTDLPLLMNAKAIVIQEHEAEIRRLERVLSMMEAAGSSPRGMPGSLDVDSRELEQFDPDLARLARLREAARLEFEMARQKFRPGHRAYGEARRNLELLEREYRERETTVLHEFVENGEMLMSLAAAEQRLGFLRREIAAERSVLAEMNRTNAVLMEIRFEIDMIERTLAEHNARIRDLEMESEAVRTARIGVQSYGERPLEPVRDRRAALAAIGAMGGFGGAFAFFFLLGTLDRRLFAAHQLAAVARGTGGVKLLGVLPVLPDGSAGARDPEASAVAAHCVHQIRNQIEAGRDAQQPLVVAVSSPYQGDGKTSLTLALGASYAASGHSTVIVDCDVAGRSLTRHLMLEGECGLEEAVKAGDVAGYLKPLDADNLSVLPAGSDPSFGPEKLRSRDLVRAFRQLRERFDVVVVDTGPLFGSVESLPVVSAVDGVVLVVWRGRRQSRLAECIEALRQVSGRCIGVVLNHAHSSDCSRYVSSSHSTAPLRSIGVDGVIGAPNRSPNGETRAPGARNALLRAVETAAGRDRDAVVAAGGARRTGETSST